MTAAAATSTSLTTDLRRLGGRPFSVDDDGQPIRDGAGRLITGAVQNPNEIIRHKTLVSLPDGLPESECRARVAAAQAEALNRNVDRLNEAVADERYHVTADYLLDESNNYSYEFRLFVADYCRVLPGAPGFYFQPGATKDSAGTRPSRATARSSAHLAYSLSSNLQVVDLAITPSVARFGTLDFGKYEAVIDAGYEAASRQLEPWQMYRELAVSHSSSLR